MAIVRSSGLDSQSIVSCSPSDATGLWKPLFIQNINILEFSMLTLYIQYPEHSYTKRSNWLRICMSHHDKPQME